MASKFSRFFHAGSLPYLLILLCWAVLYLPHLRTSPGWYGDETLTHHTATNLAKGVPSNLALWNTFWHPHYPYQPFYTFLCGLVSSTFGGDILGSRLFNAFLGLACGLAMCHLGKSVFGVRASLFAALIFLTYSQAVVHFRMSYAHNGAALGNLLLVLYLLQPASWQNNWKAGLGLSLSAGSHPLFIHPALAALVVKTREPKSWLPLLLPSFLYLLISLASIYWVFGAWLWEDLNHLRWTFLTRGAQDAPGLTVSAYNFFNFIVQDGFHLFAILGLILCLNKKFLPAGLIGLWTIFMLVKNRGNLVLFYYQAVVILPVLSLGWARLFSVTEPLLGRYQKKPYFDLLLFIIPLGMFIYMAPSSLTGAITPRNQYWVTQDTQEVERCARWLNERTQPDDLVIANSSIAWLMKCRSAPLMQVVTWNGLPTQGYENGNARERFRYNSALESAKFVVVGDIDQRWTFGEPNVNTLLEKLQTQAWPVVWKGTYYLVLANPQFSP